MASQNTTVMPNKIVIIDSDEATANLTVKIVKTLRAEKVESFVDPDEGYKAIQTGQFTGAIIDWKLKGQSSGLAILSRLRRNPEFVYFPIIISTGAAKREDLRIIEEFQCIRVIEKPLRQRHIATTLDDLKTERDWYISNERSINDSFYAASMNPEMAARAIDRILKSAPAPAPLAMIAAKHFASHEFYSQAEDLYNGVLNKDPNYLPALNGIARLYAKMNRFSDAMDNLEVAQRLSPKNIERLSLMGEIEISLRNPDAAIENFKNALALDSKDARAKIGIAVANRMSKIVELQTSAASEEISVAKMINNLGVNLAQKGEYEKALKYYLMSFSFLGAADLQWRVSFNMGLGFKKWNKLPQAKFWLEKAQQLSGGKDPKTARQLIGLEEIVAEAGIGKNSGSTAKNSKGISGTKAVPSTATPMKTFSSEPSSKTADDDMGFLQEETVGSGFSQKSTANAQSDSAIQALMQDIDNIVDLEKDFAEVFDVDITIPPSKIL